MAHSTASSCKVQAETLMWKQWISGRQMAVSTSHVRKWGRVM